MAGVPSSTLAEGAIQAVIDHLRSRLNTHLQFVYNEHTAEVGTGKINIPTVPDSAYYISEAIEPKQLPAVYVLADRSLHDLSADQWAKQEHTVIVAALVEDVEAQRLTRKVWRYAQAMFRSLHDQRITERVHVLVNEVSYSPTYGGTVGPDRKLRKDVTMRLTVVHLEPF